MERGQDNIPGCKNQALPVRRMRGRDRWKLEPGTFHYGWGKIASAGAIQYLIDHYSPDLIVNLGTCGGFQGIVKQSDVILVDQTYVYDIVELMGDLDIAIHYTSSLDLSWLAEPYPHSVRRALIASAGRISLGRSKEQRTPVDSARCQ